MAELRTAGFLLVVVYLLAVIFVWCRDENFWLPNFKLWSIAHAAIEALHGFIPFAILAMELYVLASMAHEYKERMHTIRSFEELALKERRTEYLLSIAESIRTVDSDAFFTTSSMETSSVSEGQKIIVDSAVNRKGQGNYEHRGLIAKRQEALPGAIELAIKTNIKLKFCDAVTMSRLRFFVRDNEHVVLGVAEGDQDLGHQKKTTSSVSVSSTMLAQSLRGTFDAMWDGSSDLGAYIDEVIDHRTPHLSAAAIRSWFKSVPVSEKELQLALKEHSALYRKLAADEVDGSTSLLY